MGFSLAITEYYPVADALNVNRDTTIQVTFNRDLKVETLDGNFKLEKRTGTEDNYTYTVVTGNISYSDRKATFTPTAVLDASSNYRFTVVGDDPSTAIVDGVSDIFGDGMIGSLIYSFTTNSAVVYAKPTVTTPIASTTYTVLPSISWEAVSSADGYDVRISPASDFSVDLWHTTVLVGTTVLPVMEVADGTYYVQVRYNIDGNYSPWSNSIRFFIDADYTSDVTPIEDYLEILSVSPTLIYNLATNTQFVVIFDEAVTASTVKLIDYPVSETAITPTMSNANKTMTITPILLANKQYILHIEASSTTGQVTKTLAAPYELTFTTTYTPLFCSYSDVASELGTLVESITPHTIFLGIREASIYVQQIRIAVEAANALLSPVDWTDTANLPLYVTQYAKYQGAANALASLFAQKATQSGEMRQLGDFIVQDSSGGASGGYDKLFELLQAKAKIWLDQAMELGMSRGYAKPASVVRGGEAYGYKTWHTRSIQTSSE